MYECSAVTRNTFMERAGTLSMVRDFGQRTSGLARCSAKRDSLDPLSNKVFRSSRAVQVKCRIAGGATTQRDFSRRRVGGTATPTSLLRAHGASEKIRSAPI